MAKTSGQASREARGRVSGGAGNASRTAPPKPPTNLPKPPPSNQGAVVRAFGSDPTKRYAVRYEVRELDELITSNDNGGAINPAYPAELQPRDRTRAASRQQIQRMAQKLVPDAYTAEFNSLDRGAPIIGPDNVVESGNGRTMALRLASQTNPENYDAYKRNLRESASERGINPNVLDTYQNPVLVRVRVDESVDRVTFARDANTATTLGYSDTEKSRSDASRINPRELMQFTTGGDNIDNDLNRAANRPFVREFVSQLPETDRAAVVDRDGSLTQSGRQRIKAAMFTRVYDDNRLADNIFESTDSNVKSVTNGMMSSLPRMAQAEEMVRRGERDQSLSIATDVKVAVGKYVSLKTEGTQVDTYLAQRGLFGDELTPTQQKILVEVDRNSRSGKKMGEFLGGWADIVESQPNPNQGTMFGGVSVTKEELVDRWINTSRNPPQRAMF